MEDKDVRFHGADREFICHESSRDEWIRLKHRRANFIVQTDVDFDVIATSEIVRGHSRLILKITDDSQSFVRIFRIQIFQIASSDAREE